MVADDGAAAPVPIEGQKLRVEPSGKEAGIATDTAVGHGSNLRWVLGPERGQRFGAVPLQPRLIGHEEQNPAAVREPFQTQTDAAAQPQIRLIVPNGLKAVFTGQGQNLRVLTYHHGHKAAGDGFQRPADEGFPIHLHLQLIRTEPAGVTRRQQDTSDFHSDHLIGKFQISLSIPNSDPVSQYER